MKQARQVGMIAAIGITIVSLAVAASAAVSATKRPGRKSHEGATLATDAEAGKKARKPPAR